MRHRHIVPIHIARVFGLCSGIEVGDDLVAEQIEIHPIRRAAAHRATEHIAIKRAGRRQIVNRESQVKRVHGAALG